MRYGYRSFASLLALVAIIAIAGCGGGDEASSGTPTASIDNSSKSETTPGDESAQPTEDPSHPMVKVETSLGTIVLKLNKEKAELTVDNFLAYVDSKHYDGTIFHQVYGSQGIVGGGFTEDMTEKAVTRPGVYNEAFNGLKNLRGTIAMARRSDDIHSATCQFFINVNNNPELDHEGRTLEGYGYCVFGDVV